MPKKIINDYIFYKIICLDDSCELCYVGSTVNWKARVYKHKFNSTNENSTKYNTKLYKTIRANGEWHNFKMIEIGTAEQLTKRQAEQIEEEYRVELKANMNSQRCYVSNEDVLIYKREQSKERYKNNRDKILEQHKQRYKNNRDKILEQPKKY
tara:strand:- start:230 stop:688 length:459 start_codon:yes stop_codon:yes gene_type:complete